MHGYVDETLQLRTTLKQNLRTLTPHQFERVLHPVFQVMPSTLAFARGTLYDGR